MNLWSSNLILRDIPWDYYLHPCPKFYALELAKHGPTVWVDPPSRNPLNFRIRKDSPNLWILNPWMLKHPTKGRSISTAYEHLVRDFPLSRTIFWSGDFFDPLEEFDSYKNFDLVLCLTPPKFEGIPDLYRGRKTHFNMCCDLSLFNPETQSAKLPHSEHGNARDTKTRPLSGYVGTLSARRINYPLLTKVVDRLPEVDFELVGKRDDMPDTSENLNSLSRRKNVRIVENMEYQQLAQAIRSFDVCLIPYQVNDENKGTCPTKFIEYCAMGKPIVSTSLPGIKKFNDHALLADSPDEFARMIKGQIGGCHEFIDAQLELARLSSPSSFLTKFSDQLDPNIKN